MMLRIVTFALAVACLLPVQGAQLTTATDFGPPTIRLEAAEVLHVTRSCTMPLRAGETVLTMPLGALGVAPADVWLEVEPANAVSLIAMETSPDVPGAARWRLRAEQDVDARLTITYPVKGLTWGVEYSAMLLAEGGLDLTGSLRVTNGLGRDLEDATLIGDGFQVTLSLADGETVTRELNTLGGRVPAEMMTRRLVYDKAVYGDSPVELLSFHTQRTVRITGMDIPIIGRLFGGLTGPVPPGSLRLYAPAPGGSELVTTGSIPYTPAGEPVEINLGPVSGVRVTRSRIKAVEVNKRLDASNKIAAFDLQETWRLDLQNLREEPVELLVREHQPGTWEMEEASLDYEREDAETLVFHVTLQPGERHRLNYRIRHINRQP